MKKMLTILLSMALLASVAFAGGDKNCGTKGQGNTGTTGQGDTTQHRAPLGG